jgi:hypothetical protein
LALRLTPHLASCYTSAGAGAHSRRSAFSPASIACPRSSRGLRPPHRFLHIGGRAPRCSTGFRPPPRRRDAAAHRGHRIGTLDRCGDRAILDGLTWLGSLGRRVIRTSSRARSAPRGRRGPLAGARLLLLRKPQELEEMRETRAAKAARRATTAAGGTAIRPRRPPESSR